MKHRDLVPLLCAALMVFIALAVATIAPVRSNSPRGADRGESGWCAAGLGDVGV